MNLKNLKPLASKHAAFDGAVTFYMMPYRTMMVDIVVEELQRIAPSAKWVHSETGEETYTDPHANIPEGKVGDEQRKASKWQEVGLWTDAHNLFALCDPLTVDIEFADNAPAEVAPLKAYWQNRNGSTAQRWELFAQVVPRALALEWFAAYQTTRDTTMDGPEILQAEPGEDADPNE